MGHTRHHIFMLALLLATLIVAWWWTQSGGRETAEVAVAEPDSDSADPAMQAANRELLSTQAPETAPPASTTPSPATPAQRKADTLPLDAPALGFRASPKQRAADLALLNAAPDLAPLLAEFQRRAALGDADAAARIRDIFDECFGTHTALPVGMTPTTISTTGGFGPQPLPGNDPTRLAAVASAQARCAGVLPGSDHKARTTALFRAQRDSQGLAADLGHLVSRISARGWAHDPDLRAQQDLAAARALLLEGTPEALFALAQFASDGTRFSTDAWMLAACDMGYPCADAAFLRMFWCAQFGTECATRGWTQLMQNQSSARTWRRTQAERDELLALLRAGNIDALLRPPTSAGGGG